MQEPEPHEEFAASVHARPATVSNGKRALVVEDDEVIAGLNMRLLRKEGFTVEVAGTAAEATRLILGESYDFVMLDLRLPDGSGIDVLGALRERTGSTPVLVVSGDDEIHITVGALDAGADDYLHKPYAADELRARVRALLRRSAGKSSPEINCGSVVLNRITREVRVHNNVVSLTPKEFCLLEYLVVNWRRTVTRKELLENVWRFDFDPGTNMVEVNVSRLRTKLLSHGATCRIEAERGAGYRLHDTATDARLS